MFGREIEGIRVSLELIWLVAEDRGNLVLFDEELRALANDDDCLE